MGRTTYGECARHPQYNFFLSHPPNQHRTMAEDGHRAVAGARSRSSSSSSDEGTPEITLDALSADTLAALNAHLAVKDAAEVI